MQKHLYTLVLVILLSACKSLKDTSIANEEPNTVLIVNRGACYGTCPIYKLTMYDNRSVKYNARRFTEPLGEFEWFISDREYNRIIKLLKSEIAKGNIEHNLKAIDLPLTSLDFYHTNDSLNISCKGSCPDYLKEKIRLIETTLLKSALWNER